MKVQFAAIIVEDLKEENIRHFKATDSRPNGSVLAEITVAEADQDKQYHKVQIWGSPNLHPYLKKRKVIQVEGDMSYNLSEEDGKNRKYYAVRNARVRLITDLPN